MNVLIVGNGGREHALAWKIYYSESFKNRKGKLFCTIGNPGINGFSIPVEINPVEINKITEFVNSNDINLVVIGPEIPLSIGLADNISEYTKAKVFGPSKSAAEIETSKVFAKDFMKRNSIPTANYASFNNDTFSESIEYLNTILFPVVIKADGLAAGKGVYIAESKEEAINFITDINKNQIFGESGNEFIIEEFLKGFELSVFVITDGDNFAILPTAQDHKKIGDDDKGKNTGGMGAYSPADKLINEDTFEKIKKRIILPTLRGMKNEGRVFKGCLYCGLMIVKSEDGFDPYVIEYNCRFGDPETQAVLPLIKSDFLGLLEASADNCIDDYKLEIFNSFAACVVAASEGYPDKFETGKAIEGLDLVKEETLVFHSGTKNSGDKIITNGGRVLSVVSVSNNSIDDAISKAYSDIKIIRFDNIYYRKDIGKKFAEIIKKG